jgi:anaerobic selenocysteine-containing dehydrogenase
MRSVCPHDCPSCCSLEVAVEDGASPPSTGSDHPFTQSVICGKVREYAERVHSPLRVTQPLRRVGAKGEGRFEPIGWDAAVAGDRRRWRAIIAAHGAEAILPVLLRRLDGPGAVPRGHPLFHALGATQLDRTICVSTRVRGLAGHRGAVTGNDSEQMVGADLVVLWGHQRGVLHDQRDDAGQAGAGARRVDRHDRSLSHTDRAAGRRAPDGAARAPTAPSRWP